MRSVLPVYNKTVRIQFGLAALALLASCGTPPLALDRVQCLGAKVGYSAGPPPYYGYYLVGSVSLENHPEISTVMTDWRPVHLSGESGTGSFLKDRGRTRIVERVLYFEGLIGEKEYLRARDFLCLDRHVRIEFQDVQGRSWVAEGSLDVLKSGDELDPTLKRGIAEVRPIDSGIRGEHLLPPRK
jgi:hypothetical protein